MLSHRPLSSSPARLGLYACAVLYACIAIGWSGCAASSFGTRPSPPGKAACRAGGTPSLDFSGVRAFLDIADVLQSNHEPSQRAWSRLEQTPGYATLLSHEFSPEHFKTAFRLALMPSKADALRSALASRDIRYLRHYVKVGQRLDELRSVTAGADDAKVLTAAVKRAEEWLPASRCPRHAPPVAMVIFAPDARGYSPIVVDLLFARQMTRDAFVRLLGHEFHHFSRNLLMSRPRADCLASRDAEVFWALDQLQAEGIADQISAPAQLDRKPPPAYVERYRAQMNETPARLSQFQALVLDDQLDPTDLAQAIRRALPASGHPNGYYMANVIVSALGKDRLVAHVADPFAFLRDYQEAAARQPGALFLFSTPFERYLRQLERRVRSCAAPPAASRRPR